MKFLSVISSIIFSIILLFIYLDSTLWKISVYYMGEDKQKIIYALLSISLLISFSILYFNLFKLIKSFFAIGKHNINLPKVLIYIIIGIFCFKYLFFGSLGIDIDNLDTQKQTVVTSPKIKQGSLIINNIGEVKGADGWYDIFMGFYILEDINSNKQYAVCSSVISGNNLKEDIYYEFTNPDKLILINNKEIKVSQKKEVQDFFKTNNLDFSAKMYNIKTDQFSVFFMMLLYWGVFSLLLIVMIFLTILSLPD